MERYRSVGKLVSRAGIFLLSNLGMCHMAYDSMRYLLVGYVTCDSTLSQSEY
jgi:hypothetical protein